MCDFLNLETVDKVASILGNLGIFVLTAYGFWLYHFSKNLKITSFGENHNSFEGSGLHCTIFNKTLSPKTITAISVVFNNKYLMTLKTFDEPFLLEPFHAYNIIGKRYSYEPEIPMHKDIYFRVQTPEKTIFIPFTGKIKKRKKLETITTHSVTFDNEVISGSIRYAILYWNKNEDKRHRILINDVGMMDKTILNFNQLPKDVVNNDKKMESFFKEQFSNPEIKYVIYKIGK